MRFNLKAASSVSGSLHVLYRREFVYQIFEFSTTFRYKPAGESRADGEALMQIRDKFEGCVRGVSSPMGSGGDVAYDQIQRRAEGYDVT